MSNPQKWIDRQVRLGWALLITGVVLFVAGVLVQLLAGPLPFNVRIISALGIFLFGLGIAYLVRSRAARRDPQAAARQLREEHDERMTTIRTRAGSRAYWVSAALGYALLMWVSMASNGSIPVLSEDALWYALAVVVVAPALAYLASLVYDQQHS